MADLKITGLPATSAAALTDLIEKVDDPSGTPTSEKVSLNQIKTLLDTIYDAIGSASAAQAAAIAASDPVGSASTVQGNLNTHTGLTGTSVHGLGTASTAATGDFDAAGAASTVQGNLTTHIGLTGTSVHGLGTASTAATGDFDPAGAAASAASASVAKTLFDANTIIKADTDDTPAALTVGEQTLVGRITSGVITALSATQSRTLLNVEDGADVTDSTNVNAAGAVMESDYNANTILAATVDDTPAALTVAEQTLVGRITSGDIAALTATQVRTLLNVADGSKAGDVVGPASAGDNEVVLYDSTTGKLVKVSGVYVVSGDVGIGSSTPGARLDVVNTGGSSGPQIRVLNNTAAATNNNTYISAALNSSTQARVFFRIETISQVTTDTSRDSLVKFQVCHDGSFTDAMTFNGLDATLAGVTTLAKGVVEKSVTLTSSSNELTLSSDYNIQVVNGLNEATEIQLPDMSGWAAGTVRRIDLYIKQDGTGSRVITFETGWDFAGGVAPTPSTGASEVDHYVITCVKDLSICTIGLAEADLS